MINSNKKLKSSLLNDHEFHELSQLFVDWTGNKLGNDKRGLVESRIMKRLLETQLTPSDYVKEVKNNEKERECFVSSLTTHKTDWFREPIHFNFLLKKVIEENHCWNKSHPLLIWSAVCSTGEEVYSLCLALLEEEFVNFRILGSDISDSCLETAKNGLYQQKQVEEQVPENIKIKYFSRSIEHKNKNLYCIDLNLKKYVKWKKFNLLESNLSSSIKFDFIFLRNVLIYFKSETITQVIKRLLPYLKEGGFLIAGLSENISNYQDLGLILIGSSIYKYGK